MRAAIVSYRIAHLNISSNIDVVDRYIGGMLAIGAAS